MMKRLLLNFKKDWTLGFRNYYLVITIATAVLFYLFLTFLMPDDYQRVSLYLYTDPALGVAIDAESNEEFNFQKVDSRDAVYESMQKDVNGFGLVIEQGSPVPVLTLVTQGSQQGDMANLLKLELSTVFSEYITTGEEYEVEYEVQTLHPEMDKIDLRDNFLPVFLVMESSFIGFFLISVMLFAEKDQRMHTAYLVSPGGLTEHLLSKVLVMLALGYVSAFSMTLALRGFEANYWRLFVAITVSSFLSSSLGLLMGGIFGNLQKAMFILISLIFLLMLPIITFIFPGFSPDWVKVLPTYTMLHAVRNSVIPIYGTAEFYRNVALLFGEGLVVFCAARVLYARSLWATS